MDNSTIHKGEEIQAAIEAVGAKLVFLSPYSPEFNPIENLWSKLKSILRRIGARTYQDNEEQTTNNKQQTISEAVSVIDKQQTTISNYKKNLTLTITSEN